MLREHKINKKNNFISAWYLDDDKLCNDLINYYEKNPFKMQGKVGDGWVDKDVKDSTDIFVLNLQDTVIKKYLVSLSNVLEQYKKKYEYCSKGQGKWGLTTKAFNIQKYNPNQAYHGWHSERTGMNEASRHLAFMTYLNDVNDGGETQFYYQDLKIKPEKGLTVIWGTDWTFQHKGLVSTTETKYITTGHYHYE